MSGEARARSSRSFVVAVLGGALAGAAVSVVLPMALGRVASATPTSAAVPAAPVAAVARVEAPARAGEMAADRVREQANEFPAAPASAPGRAPEPSVADTPPSPEASRAAHVAAHEAALASHRRDPPDPKWAPAASAAFTSDLRAEEARSHFKLGAVDCRMTSCAATVTFDDARAANEHFGDLLHLRYATNCAREVTLDPSNAETGPVTTTVIFDCTELRAR